MRSTTATTVTLLSTLALSAAASAQAPWNRGAEGIAVLPDGKGGWNVHAYVSASAGESTAPLDLSMEALLLNNGTPTHSFSHFIQGGGATGGCASECHISGQSCVCLEGTGFCGCGTIVFCIAGVGCVPAGNAMPEDEIMVLLRPSPGALPEDDESDDVRAVQFTGAPIFWNRRIVSAHAEPTADSFFDVFFEIEFEGNGADDNNVDTLVQLIEPASGAVIAEQMITGVIGDPPVGGSFDRIVLPPDGPIIKLVPVPGALPELPGFEEDDEQEVDRTCAEDVDEDGSVGVSDLLAVLAAWDTDDESADINEDGIVDIADLLALLAKWGPCPAV